MTAAPPRVARVFPLLALVFAALPTAAAAAAAAVEVESFAASVVPAGAAWDYVLDIVVRANDADSVSGTIPLAGSAVVAAEASPLGDGRHRLRFPLGGLASGDHVARVAGRNVTATEVAFSVAVGTSDTAAFRARASALPLDARVASLGEAHVLVARAALSEATGGVVSFTRAGAPVAREAVESVVLHAAGSSNATAARTDPGGRAAWRLDPREAAPAGGLPLAVVYLTGAERTVGAVAVAVPVADRDATVANVLADDAGLRVLVEGAPAAGRVFVVKGDRALASGAIEGGEARVALPYPEGTGPLASHALVALTEDGNGRLASFGLATRGVDVDAAHATFAPRAQAAMSVVVRSFNDNLNGRADATMQATVRLAARDLPGGGDHATEVTIAEGGEAVVSIPLPADKPVGEHTVRLEATMGELVARRDVRVTIAVADTAIERALDAIPAPPAALAIALALALALARPRRGAA